MWSSKPKLPIKSEYLYYSIATDLLLSTTKLSGSTLSMLHEYRLHARLIQVSQVEIGLNLGNSLIQGLLTRRSYDENQVHAPTVIVCGVSRGRLEFGKQSLWDVGAFEDKIAVHALFEKAIVDLR